MKVAGQRSLSLPQRLTLFIILWTAGMRSVMGMPRPNMQHFGPGNHAQAYLYPAKTAPTEASFSPQPQYITLTPPMAQMESQNEVELEGISRLATAEGGSLFAGQVVGAYAAGEGAAGTGNRHERGDSVEDWEAWKQQFNIQVKQRRCRLARAMCGPSMRR